VYPALHEDKRCWAFRSIFGSGWECVDTIEGIPIRHWRSDNRPPIEYEGHLYVLPLKRDKEEKL
jgi:hypothetical protein